MAAGTGCIRAATSWNFIARSSFFQKMGTYLEAGPFFLRGVIVLSRGV